MQESYSEGVASHTGPESCGYAGNGLSEALTGEYAGRVLSRVSLYIADRSADAVENVGRQHWTGWTKWCVILCRPRRGLDEIL